MQTVYVRSPLSVFVVVISLLQGCATTETNKEVSMDEPAMAAMTAAPVSGYVIDSTNQVVTSPQDECVRTTMWKPGNSVATCDQVAPAKAKMPNDALVSYNGRALFDFDSATLTGTGSGELDGLIKKLNAQDKIKSIQIVGHTDSVGSDAYNQKLSENRAGAVQQYLQRSLRTVSVSAKGMGESIPVADNNTEAGRRLNRRVDVNIAAFIQQ